MKFPFYKQPDAMDCGPTCIRMVAKHHGKSYSLAQLRKLSYTTREGSSLLGMSDAAEKIGFRTLAVKVDFDKFQEEAPLPCIAHWNQNHFVVIYKIKKELIYVADPGYGLLTYTKAEFLKCWASTVTDKQVNKEVIDLVPNGNLTVTPNGEIQKTPTNTSVSVPEGILLLLEPTPSFYHPDKEGMDAEEKKGFAFLFRYLFRYKKLAVQLVIGLITGSLLQLLFPFLTQSVVDVGIQHQDVHFIYLILFAQLMLFLGRTGIELIRSWLLLHISSRINISLISDFFIKLMKLPISFFDIKMTGDIMQRINDHNRIQQFLTSASLNVLFSLVNIIIFGAVLAFYNLKIFALFLIGSTLYFVWILLFLKKRAALDYKNFQQMSQNQSKIMELINGMQEIKLHNAEKQKRWAWENIQVKLFKLSIKGLTINQFQETGSSLINELKNIGITILAAKLVIEGQITLGMMLSISYITGQLNSPIMQLVSFTHSLQDAKISLERLSEIHNRSDEEQLDEDKITELNTNDNIDLKEVCFSYTPISDPVLINLSIRLPAHKVTAVVGSSGSGKTTLMKLLLKFYEPTAGEITIGAHRLNDIVHKSWREKCGVVMQEGYIFSDTIANNIAVGAEVIDKKRLKHAVSVANIQEYIDSLPLGYNTMIGQEGIGLSTGQKQRMLIARAVYKNPDYLFFDEATSALDANNEKVIMDNLNTFFKGKTALIIAHRLSTVKNADNIIVLEKGKIVEQGTHAELTLQRGVYFNLVKNQLELGN